MSRPRRLPAELAEAAPVFAALGDPTRLALLERLSGAGPLSITHLTAGTSVSRQAVTKHLTVLAGVGLVHHRRHGREHLWTLDPERLAEAQRSLELISQRWDEALGRLRQFVEEEPE